MWRVFLVGKGPYNRLLRFSAIAGSCVPRCFQPPKKSKKSTSRVVSPPENATHLNTKISKIHTKAHCSQASPVPRERSPASPLLPLCTIFLPVEVASWVRHPYPRISRWLHLLRSDCPGRENSNGGILAGHTPALAVPAKKGKTGRQAPPQTPNPNLTLPARTN